MLCRRTGLELGSDLKKDADGFDDIGELFAAPAARPGGAPAGAAPPAGRVLQFAGVPTVGHGGNAVSDDLPTQPVLHHPTFNADDDGGAAALIDDYGGGDDDYDDAVVVNAKKRTTTTNAASAKAASKAASSAADARRAAALAEARRVKAAAAAEKRQRAAAAAARAASESRDDDERDRSDADSRSGGEYSPRAGDRVRPSLHTAGVVRGR